MTIVPRPVVPADIDTYDDHRMAMSFGVATLRAPGLRILDPGCTAKTFPDFLHAAFRARRRIASRLATLWAGNLSDYVW